MRSLNHEIVVIGWHDGIIEAMLPVATGKWMYASMIAWSPEDHLRIYGLIELDDETAVELRLLLGESESNRQPKEEAWSALRRRISAFLRQADGFAELRLCEDLSGEALATIRLQAVEVVPFMGQEVDETVKRERFERLLARIRC